MQSAHTGNPLLEDPYQIRYVGLMARRLVQYVEISDDFDRGNPADETVEVAIDGTVYELDLTAEVAAELRGFLAKFQEVAHDRWKMPARPGRKGKPITAQDNAVMGEVKALPRSGQARSDRDRDARTAMREWAREQGYEVGGTGQLRSEIVVAYRETFPDAYIPPSTLEWANVS